jgi:hypothetical protein
LTRRRRFERSLAGGGGRGEGLGGAPLFQRRLARRCRRVHPLPSALSGCDRPCAGEQRRNDDEQGSPWHAVLLGWRRDKLAKVARGGSITHEAAAGSLVGGSERHGTLGARRLADANLGRAGVEACCSRQSRPVQPGPATHVSGMSRHGEPGRAQGGQAPLHLARRPCRQRRVCSSVGRAADS